MKVAIILAAALLIAGLLLWLGGRTIIFDRPRGLPRTITPKSITVDQIPIVVAQLRNNGAERAFAAFAFSSKSEPATDDTVVNLQYSVEAGSIGLDWVLIAPRNKKDKDKVAAFITGQKHRLLEKEGNGVHYLRVEDGDIALLGVQIAEELYHLQNSDEVALFVDKFEFQP